MAIRPVICLPHSVLQQPARDVDFAVDDTHALAADLVDTMRVSPGCVGLAAPQIAVGLRAFCLDVTGHKKAQSTAGLVVMFNPRVVDHVGSERGREGCMSVPDFTGDVVRHTQLTVAGFDAGGLPFDITADAFEARAFQHELDHLDGLLFLDRVSSPRGVFPRKVYR